MRAGTESITPAKVRASGLARPIAAGTRAFSVSVAGAISTPVTAADSGEKLTVKSVAAKSPGRAPNGCTSNTGSRMPDRRRRRRRGSAAAAQGRQVRRRSHRPSPTALAQRMGPELVALQIESLARFIPP